MPQEPDRFEHGLWGYRHGCRCLDCKAGKSAQYIIERDSRAARLQADPTLRPHGNRNTYVNWGCRCELCCKAGYKDYTSPRRKRLLYLPVKKADRIRPKPFGREWL